MSNSATRLFFELGLPSFLHGDNEQYSRVLPHVVEINMQ